MTSLFKKTYGMLLKGLAVVVPLLVTAYIIVWLITILESWCRNLIVFVLPERYYLPGLGFAVGIIAVALIGLLFQTWLFRKIWTLVERGLHRVPLVKSIYGAVKDFTDFIRRSATDQAQKVVTVRLPGSSMRLIGLVTREDFTDLPEGIGGPETIAVYLPMSYQIGGFTVMLPQEDVQRIDLSVEEAMRFALTGAMTVEPSRGRAAPLGGEDNAASRSAQEAAG
jgi:uncharacterized membrane protein